jgi:hypothetical protein
VCFCSLRVEELADALAVQFDSDTTADLVTGWRPDDTEDTILSACSSLIAVVKVDASPIVQFSHFSVKEYLTSNRLAMAQAMSVSRYRIPAESAHKILAQAGTGNTATSGCTREGRQRGGDGCMKAAFEFDRGVGRGLMICCAAVSGNV